VRLGTLRKIGVLLVPWAFLCVFAALYIGVLVPRLGEGHLAVVCVGGFAALVFGCFFVAAITFSRDVLLDRWPAPPN
jgi:hypothetical protein